MTDDKTFKEPRAVSGLDARPLMTVFLWSAMTALGVWLSQTASNGSLLLLAGAVGLGVSLAFSWWSERSRWVRPVRILSERVDALVQDPNDYVSLSGPLQLETLADSLRAMGKALRRASAAGSGSMVFTLPGDSGTTGPQVALARNGVFESGSGAFHVPFDAQTSGEFSTTEMVNRLEPRLFRWRESSIAEQKFLGWNLTQLREKSFLEIVHPDDLDRVREELRTALAKGEVHGLVLRIRTSFGKARAIEMNVGARYGQDMNVSHLRCHVTDVTAKVKAGRETRLRTRELTQVNEQLRLINRELEDLKERYRDLYQNAPAMYFSLDNAGRILDCNDTLFRTLGYRAGDLIGQRYDSLLPASRRALFAAKFSEFLEKGSIEVASRWVKANGETIDVWVHGTAVRGPDGQILHSRSVAQDVTARHRLEAELQEKNAQLATTIDELSRRNREMDEFTYVVSHDLQEPLRTLNAFSDFLLRDYGAKMDTEGKEFVQHIVDASRRMRSLIRDLLNLSRVGKVTAEFASVNLEELTAVVRADLGELIRSKGATVDIVGPLPKVWGDRSRLGQLLTNLVGNAIKYNEKSDPLVQIGVVSAGPAEQTVSAATPLNEGFSGSTDEVEEWLTLFVRDNGIGIEPQFHEKIFQLFRRLHTREEYEGTGAGLAICLKIAQAHGGKIWVESQPQYGSTFFVSLRRSPVAAEITCPMPAYATKPIVDS